MQANDNFLNKTFLRFLPATIFSVLGGTINIMVDSIIVGNCLGETALASITLCTPVYLILCTLGSLYAGGAGILSTVALGKNDDIKSKKHYTFSLMMIIITGIIFTAAGVIFIDPIVNLLGANSESYGMVRDYTLVTILGGIFKLLLYIPFNYLRIDGKPGYVSVLLIAMTVTNAGLDILFIVVLGWGMTGAAVASVIGTAIAAIAGMIVLARPSSGFHVIKGALKGFKKEFCEVVKTGSPFAANNLFSALRISLINIVLLAAGGNPYVTVFTVVNSLSEFALCVINGVPQTASAIIGIYSGERDNSGIRIILRKQLSAGIILSLILVLGLVIFPSQLCSFFGLSECPDYAAFAVYCLALSLPLGLINNSLCYLYNTTGRIGLANIITTCRILLFAVISAAFIVQYSSEYVWLFYPLAEVLTFILVLITTVVIRIRKKELTGLYLLDDTLEKSGRIITFSVFNNINSIVEASEKISTFCDDNDFTPRQSMAVSLAIEEMISVIIQKCFSENSSETVDVRAFKSGDVIGLRLRNGGAIFNPIAYFEHNTDNEELMGIKMITKLAKSVQYQRTFGVNSVIILL